MHNDRDKWNRLLQSCLIRALKRKGVSHYVGSALIAGFVSMFPAYFAYTAVEQDKPADSLIVGVWLLFTVPGTFVVASIMEPSE